MISGDYEEAVSHHEIEWQLASHEENDQARCQARVNLGAALRHTPEKCEEVDSSIVCCFPCCSGSFQAIEHLREAILLAKKLDSGLLEARATFELSFLYAARESQEEAAHFYSVALAIVTPVWETLDINEKTRLSAYLHEAPIASAAQLKQEAADAAAALTDFGFAEAFV